MSYQIVFPLLNRLFFLTVLTEIKMQFDFEIDNGSLRLNNCPIICVAVYYQELKIFNLMTKNFLSLLRCKLPKIS